MNLRYTIIGPHGRLRCNLPRKNGNLRHGNSCGKVWPVAKTGDPHAVAFGGRVKEARSRRDLSQVALAEMMTSAGYPMHHTTVAKLEAGTRPTSVSEVFALSAILGVRPADLLGEPASELPGEPAELPDFLAEVVLSCEAFRKIVAEAASAEQQRSSATMQLGWLEIRAKQLRDERDEMHRALLDAMNIPMVEKYVRTFLVSLLGPDGLRPPVDEKAGR